MPLTSTEVKNAKPGPKARRLYGARWLYLEISPKGGKWWRFKYRIDGKEKRLSLDAFPNISLKDARERREEARKLVAKGIDPSARRKAEKDLRFSNGANTFEVVAREWWTKQVPGWSGELSGSSKLSARLTRILMLPDWISRKPAP